MRHSHVPFAPLYTHNHEVTMFRAINHVMTSTDSEACRAVDTHRRRSRRIPLAAALLLSGAAGCAMEEATAGDEPLAFEPGIVERLGSEFSTDGEALATIEVPQGPTLHFIALGDSGAGDASVGVVEIGRVDGYRLDNAFGLDTANAREIFHAVTDAEVAEPELLTKLFPEPQLGARGWFLDAIESDTLVTTKLASCQSASFVSSFEAWNPDINDGAGYDIETQPYNDGNWSQSDPFAAGGCAYSGLPCMYEWESTPGNYYTVYNVDRYKTRVRVCDLQYRSTISYQGTWQDVGPVIAFRYQQGGNSSTGTAFSQDIDSTTAEGYYWQWLWSGSASPDTNNDYDWKTQVDLAWKFDEYSIGYAWKHEGW